MRNRRRRNKAKHDLERQLETAKDRYAKLQLQVAKFGTLHAPVYKLIEVDEAAKKIATLEKQIAVIQRSSPLFRLVERSKRTTRRFSDLFFPRDQAAHRRRRYRFRNWYAKIGTMTLKGMMIGAVFLVLVLIAFVYAHTTQTSGAQLVQIVPILPVSPTISPAALNGNPRSAIVVTSTGHGVFYRTAPRFDAKDGNGPQEGEIVYLMRSITNDQGELWWEVKQQDGRTGYIPDQLLQKQ